MKFFLIYFREEFAFKNTFYKVTQTQQKEIIDWISASKNEDMKVERIAKALDMLASLIGTQAGNVALTYLPTGGVYLGGGMPPRIIDKLKKGATVRAYADKGRLSEFVRSIPLFVIMDDEAATYGAGHIAARL